VAADDGRIEVVPAAVHERVGRGVHRPLVTPGAQHLEHRPQFLAGLGELVLIARRVIAVLTANHQTGRFQRAQPRGEPVAGRAGVLRDHVEPLVAEGDLAHGQQCPLLADQIQGRRHRAGAAGQFLAHNDKLTWVAKSN
jgi:hypothetical protein